MIQHKLLNIDQLKPYGSVGSFSELAKTLVEHQKANWNLANQNYKSLAKNETKSFEFDGFKVNVQFNPERIRSSAAKTDSKTISERPCFLCSQNLPPEQKGFLILDNYLVLVNPYPIFPLHLTISDIHHTPQIITGRLDDLLQLSKELLGFTVFYNGPKCGASAPDHFHFQAVIKGYLPFENDITDNSEIVENSEEIQVAVSKNYLRRFISLKSANRGLLVGWFNFLYNQLEKRKQPGEPMMNILCSYSDSGWQLTIFPRDKQRPSHFFSEGEKQIVVGPAAVELGGLIILPKKEDFDKITRREIIEIYEEVTINEIDFRKIIETAMAQSR